MQKRYLIVLLISFEINQILCQNHFGKFSKKKFYYVWTNFDLNLGSIFLISLAIENDDPKFDKCPNENGAYAHSTNCSVFHMCTFGIHALYSCIDGFYFNSYSGKCQYFPMVNETRMKCEDIIRQLTSNHVLPLPKLGQSKIIEKFDRISISIHSRSESTSKI